MGLFEKFGGAFDHRSDSSVYDDLLVTEMGHLRDHSEKDLDAMLAKLEPQAAALEAAIAPLERIVASHEWNDLSRLLSEFYDIVRRESRARHAAKSRELKAAIAEGRIAETRETHAQPLSNILSAIGHKLTRLRDGMEPPHTRQNRRLSERELKQHRVAGIKAAEALLKQRPNQPLTQEEFDGVLAEARNLHALDPQANSTRDYNHVAKHSATTNDDKQNEIVYAGDVANWGYDRATEKMGPQLERVHRLYSRVMHDYNEALREGQAASGKGSNRKGRRHG